MHMFLIVNYHAVDVPILLQLYFSKAFHCFGLPEAAPRRAAGNACLKKRSSRASWLDAILIPFIAYSRKETDNGVIHSFYSSQCKTNITFAVASKPSGTRAPR